MAITSNFLNSLLQRTEDNSLDFKVQQYKLKTTKQKSGFIKDVLSMANTPRNCSAYIVVGVAEKDGRPFQVVGVKDHVDPSELDRQLQDRVSSVPSIEYHVANHKGREVGIYEIKIDSNGPFVAQKKFGRLDLGAIYFRRNSQNTVATTSHDIDRIAKWFGGIVTLEEPPETPDLMSWQHFHRACDGFDDRKAFICVIDKNEQASADDWQAFGRLGWDLIVDFDVETDQTGAYSKAHDTLNKLRSLKLTPLDGELPDMGPGATLWVAARGTTSRPTTVQADSWREWNRSKQSDLRAAIKKIARLTDVKPATLLVFGGESSFVRTVCELIDASFHDRVDFVFANPKNHQYSDILEMFSGIDAPILFGEACRHIGEMSLPGSEPSGVEIPKLEGGAALVPPERARWIEEEFDIVHLPAMVESGDIQTEIKGFHQGRQISSFGLNAGIDVHRDKLESIERRVREGLAARSVRRLDLAHWPGAGGSTLGRRVAWNVHKTYPAIVVHTVHPHSNLDRIRYLFDISNQPVLVVIDSPSATTTDIDRLFDLVRGSNVWAVILRVARYYGDSPQNRSAPFLDAMLSTPEAVAFEQRLATLVPERSNSLRRLSEMKYRRRRTPFNYGLTAFGRDFQGIESYVSSRLDRCSDYGRLLCLISSLVYHYGQQTIPIQLFAKSFGLSQSKVVRLSDVVDGFVEDLFVRSKETIRPIHELIAEEILRQLLGHGRAHDNWKFGLANSAIQLAEVCAEQPTTSGTHLSEMLQTVFLARHSDESDADFSRLLNDIPSTEAQERVLTKLTHLFPYEPHFWAHLGRFRSLVIRNHSKAHEAHRMALQLEKEDPTLHHMAGMSFRAELYDLLATAKWDDEIEEQIKALVDEAAETFHAARQLDRRNEHGYIAHVQMLERVINAAAIRKGYRYRTHEFLVTPQNMWYMRLLDQAESLLVDLTVARGGDSPSRYEMRMKSALAHIYGDHAKAIQGWTNLLTRRDIHCPPVRRNIINAYLARRKGSWSSLTQHELGRILELAEQNLAEEARSDQNVRLWFRAARLTGRVSVNRAAETLGLRKLRRPTIDTLYYLYILKFLQSDEGALSMAGDALELIGECRAISINSAFPRTRAFEWLGKQTGLRALVNVSDLGEWDGGRRFWSNEELLRRVPGIVSKIQSPASGQIELANGLTAFFVPSTVTVDGGYVRGLHEGRRVEFYLGFSYEGLRAWSVQEVEQIE